ncbi:SDR family oxidoreductase [Streptomyces europaeiscabiei]|uniref:SDR family oxidoreductase n=1 Tax=Streptomyces europaeiscabiei TaxID=146819 RepID=A0ABU4NI92_9ACTN|nr:SDR family oxidoreductase [Streptomyces europaeiscabiei]MDX2524454.1 SDR family oxidoreductase [Streptomyces europaeiscabiei]MDX3545719.1 SDR family oxidoreductase [Streptomyces europaeiscabiei]MDX3554883.1 SDR family oxidoreductase [Streptomyces europaeiscabiei]MDX3702850.1 SDR family oxidoreductase [Streptomyces europaeiscabiei]MDX3710409.1 SDR family oxidoreductase [Streptomyces europaeiscabiei]
MKAVVHRGARTLEIESRVTEAPALAKEWGGRGVNVIAPGCIATDNTEALRADPQHNQAILGRIPAGRWRGADDLAGARVFLASSASDHVNGIVLPVDGGWLGR